MRVCFCWLLSLFFLFWCFNLNLSLFYLFDLYWNLIFIIYSRWKLFVHIVCLFSCALMLLRILLLAYLIYLVSFMIFLVFLAWPCPTLFIYLLFNVSFVNIVLFFVILLRSFVFIAARLSRLIPNFRRKIVACFSWFISFERGALVFLF